MAQNLSQFRENVLRSAIKVGRDPEEIKLVAVTKGISIERTRELYAAGIKAFGENRVQELLAKKEEFPAGVEWHLIGHLQTNKVRKVVGKVCLIHSLDSWRLAREISDCATEAGLIADVLVQVNVAGEKTKYGLPPSEAAGFINEASRLPGLRIRGLMAIAPLVEDIERIRWVFRETRILAQEIKSSAPKLMMDYLSMGMSNDYTVAVEEGANILRVGRALLGMRTA